VVTRPRCCLPEFTEAEDRGFESCSLQQGVCCEPASLHQIKFRPRITKIEGQRATAQNCDPAPVFPDMVKKWGFGFMISTEPVPGGRSAGSLAWAGLGNTYFWIDLHRGVAGVILM
jgi:CubicO group peptidase (beta-lactamase class C family)